MPDERNGEFSASECAACPLPKSDHKHILLGHGSGGTLSAELIKNVFLPRLGDDAHSALEDSATLACEVRGQLLVMTTDSFVVRPLFFPGGDIGRLAVHGTVNDLAVSGAKPLALSAAFILEEGAAITDLERIADSMRDACREAGVHIVTGDTKVVDRGKGDQVFITTTGIGLRPAELDLSIQNARPGDVVLVSGTIGDHGVAIMSLREGIQFETALQSDSAPLNGLTSAMLTTCSTIRCMRDPTRGGLATALNELASASGAGVKIDEAAIPIREEVRAACELLGLDPLYVANEGKLIAVAQAEDADRLLKTMRGHPLGRDAAIIGRVVDEHRGMVTHRSLIGGERIVSMLAGEQLPRIC